MKRISILSIMYLLAAMGVWAQDETQYRTIDTTLVFSESDFIVGTHSRTGNQSIGRANQEDTEWNRPKEEMASVPWRVVKIFVARDESLVDINCEAEDETLYIENLNLRQQNGESLNEDFPKNRVYVQGFTSTVNAEHTGFLYFYQFLVSPFRYDSQNNNFYLYKEVHLMVRVKKNAPTILTIPGTVKDQDGQPLPNATLTFAGTEYDIKESGEFQMVFSLPTYTDGWPVQVSGKLEVKEEGYTSYEGQASFDEEWTYYGGSLVIVLNNKIHYKAGKRYTLILPEDPDASLGRYFRLDRVEDNKIVFERESSPEANTPYVFFPENDVTISLEGMDLTQEPGCTIVNDNPNPGPTDMDSRVFLEGSYVSGSNSKYFFAPSYIRMREIGENNGSYILNAMRATMYYYYNKFSGTPELVFHDPDNEATTIHNIPEDPIITHQSPNHQYYDLSGRHISTPPIRNGVYIKDGRKVMIK